MSKIEAPAHSPCSAGAPAGAQDPAASACTTPWHALPNDLFERLPLGAGDLGRFAQVARGLRRLPDVPGARRQAWLRSTHGRDAPEMLRAARALAASPTPADVAVLQRLCKLRRDQLDFPVDGQGATAEPPARRLGFFQLRSMDFARPRTAQDPAGRWLQAIARLALGGLCELLLEGAAPTQAVVQAALVDLGAHAALDEVQEEARQVHGGLALLQGLEALDAPGAPDIHDIDLYDTLEGLVRLPLRSARPLRCMMRVAELASEDLPLQAVLVTVGYILDNGGASLYAHPPEQFVDFCAQRVHRAPRSVSAAAAMTLMDTFGARVGALPVSQAALAEIYAAHSGSARVMAGTLLSLRGALPADAADELLAHEPAGRLGGLALSSHVLEAAQRADAAGAKGALHRLLGILHATPHASIREAALRALGALLVALQPQGTQMPRLCIPEPLLSELVALCSGPEVVAVAQQAVAEPNHKSGACEYLVRLATRTPGGAAARAALAATAQHVPLGERERVAEALREAQDPALADALATLGSIDAFGCELALVGLAQLIAAHPQDARCRAALARVVQVESWILAHTAVQVVRRELPRPLAISILTDIAEHAQHEVADRWREPAREELRRLEEQATA